VLTVKLVKTENVVAPSVKHYVAVVIPALILSLIVKTAELAVILWCEADETCVNGVCVDCVQDSDCVSDFIVNRAANIWLTATGTCINNVCYVCAGCLPSDYCSTFENTGGVAYGSAQ
ncbi:14056_t:CDS:2, partial [Acaulospora morrowiae]